MARRWDEIRNDKASQLRDADLEEKVAAVRWAMEDASCLASLVAARQRLGITQTSIADALGVSRARVSRLERQRDLYFSTLRDYIEAIGGRLEVTAVFERDGHEDRVSIGAAHR